MLFEYDYGVTEQLKRCEIPPPPGAVVFQLEWYIPQSRIVSKNLYLEKKSFRWREYKGSVCKNLFTFIFVTF